MRIIHLILSILVSATLTMSTSYSEETPLKDAPPLKIGVAPFNPPFTSQGGNKELFGFDVSMMQFICKAIQRQCVFITMPFLNLLPAVKNGEIDIAVSDITVTPERAALANFSLPYLKSDVRFLGRTELSTQPFDLALLNKSSIGILQGSAFRLVLKSVGATNAKIVEYNIYSSLIEALRDGKINLALIDNPSAMYWQTQTSNIFKALGTPISFGYGFAIAVNKQDPKLLEAINRALVLYKQSPEYQRDYDTYIASF
ncbi:MAG: transporter substrate-binding domain-containing protein [Legionella sp.]|nr:transporter substrate-binding domain-containing protein [Legionella sp.]